MQPGVYPLLSNANYHAGPGISKSQLDWIARSPEYYQLRKSEPTEQTEALAVGTALHLRVGEPESFAECVEVLTVAKTRCKKFFDACENPLKVYLTVSEAELVSNLANAILANPLASQLLAKSNKKVEHSYYWEDPLTGKLCRCRPDITIDDRIMVDIKTSRESPADFWRSARSFRYHVQGAWYSDGFQHATGKTIEHFLLLAVTKTAPFEVMIYRVAPESLERGRQLYRQDLDRLIQCEQTGIWTNSTEIMDLAI